MANNDDDSTNNSYLAMLNNPVINPPRSQQQQQQLSCNTTHVAQSSPPMFEAAQHCQDKLQSYAKDLYLVSETDAPWQNVLVKWSSNELPRGRQELDDAGVLVRNTEMDQFTLDEDDNDDGFKVESLDVFFDRHLVVDGNNKAQANQDTALPELIKQLLGENVKVYLVGKRVITVLILGIVQDGDGGMKALVGLQSELVET